jgi:hypothetical protein
MFRVPQGRQTPTPVLTTNQRMAMNNNFIYICIFEQKLTWMLQAISSLAHLRPLLFVYVCHCTVNEVHLGLYELALTDFLWVGICLPIQVNGPEKVLIQPK